MVHALKSAYVTKWQWQRQEAKSNHYNIVLGIVNIWSSECMCLYMLTYICIKSERECVEFQYGASQLIATSLSGHYCKFTCIVLFE